MQRLDGQVIQGKLNRGGLSKRVGWWGTYCREVLDGAGGPKCSQNPKLSTTRNYKSGTWYIVIYLSLNMSALDGASGCKYTLLVVSLGRIKG